MPHGIQPQRRCPSGAAGQNIMRSAGGGNNLRPQQHQLPRGCRQPILRPGATTPPHSSRGLSSATAPSTPLPARPQLGGSSSSSNASSPAGVPSPVANNSPATTARRSVAASAMWGLGGAGSGIGSFGSSSGSSFGAATKQQQQQQYVRHVQQDLPGGASRQQQQKQPAGDQQQTAWPSQWQPAKVEARNRGNKGHQPTGQEPVSSYTDLFSHEMTPTAAAAAGKGGSRQQQSKSSNGSSSSNGNGKGFSKSKGRKAGSSGSNGKGSGRAANPGNAHVQLCITHAVEFGQTMRLTGSGEPLGAWDCNNGPELQWHEGHTWSADVTLPSGSYEFKFLIQHRSGHLEWENGNNRSFTVPATAAEIAVEGHWGATEDTEVHELESQPSYRQVLNLDDVDSATAALRDLEASARAEEAAFAAANAAAAAAYKQLADAEASVPAVAPVGADRIVTPLSDLFTFDLSVLDSDMPGHQQLMQVLLSFRHDMRDGLTGVTVAMQEIQDELSQVQQHMSRLAAERVLGAAPLAPGDHAAVGGDPATAAIIAADAAVSQEQALSGLQGVVQNWQHELVTFKQESLDLRHEIESLRVSLESQMASNTNAVQDLEALVKQLMSMEGGLSSITGGSSPPPKPRAKGTTAVVPPPAAGGVGGVGGPHQGPGSGGPPGSSELLDAEDKLLLERINHLASDLSEEMKEAVQELELQQQSLLERHQHIIADMSQLPAGSGSSKDRLALDLGFGAGLGMRMTPTTKVLQQRQQQQQQAPAAAPHVMRAINRWLESRDVVQYHQGLLLAVMVSSGLWQDSLWKQLENGDALRSTFRAYKGVWSEACLQTWKDNITTKQALLLALSTGRQQLLSMHILWSLQELSTHCSGLAQLLPEVATPIEQGLMQKLRDRGGAGQGWALGVTGAPVGGGEAAAAAQCAVLLQRWLAAAADEGQW